MITEAEKYLGYPYVWGGSSPSTSFDCSGFVSWVINHSGWNVGRLGAQGLYNICTPVSPANAKPGDLIFFQHTYDTTGASHVGIYVGNNMMIHCGDPDPLFQHHRKLLAAAFSWFWPSAQPVRRIRMIAKIVKLKTEREKNSDKISELQARNKKLDGEITELENTDIVGMVRELGLTPESLAELLKVPQEKPCRNIQKQY
jgi:cell wall-associated NlpC family hydrolase